MLTISMILGLALILVGFWLFLLKNPEFSIEINTKKKPSSKHDS